MKYKSLLMDIDNTIVPTNGKLLDERLISKIKQAQEVIHVGVATSRSIKKVLDMLETIELKGPNIFANGAQVIDPANGEVYKEDFLTFEQVEKATEVVNRYKRGLYVYDNSVKRLATANIQKTVTAFVLALEPQEADELMKEFLLLGGVAVHKTISGTQGCNDVHITHRDASKDKAVRKLAEVLGIKTSEIIGVGDGPNDILLLEACGLKVVMGNASDELKKVADYIAPSVEEMGVVDVIDRFILESC